MNETFGCLEQKIQRQRKKGDNVDKRITGFDRQTGDNMDKNNARFGRRFEEQRVREERSEQIDHVMSGEASKSPNMDS